MAEDFEVTIDTKRLEAAMKKAPEALYRRLREAFRLGHQKFLNRFKRERLRSGKSEDGVQSRSRRLSRSFDSETRGDSLATLETETYSAGVRHARIHEYGGEIVPRTKQYLTIPLDAARAGDREGAIARTSARHFSNTFFLTTKVGKLLLMGSPTEGRSDEVKPLFLLVKSVMLKARLGFRKLWNEMEPAYLRMINAAVDAALAEGA